MTYSYIIGPTPYENSEKWRQKGNGEWSTKADNLQSALETIFGSMPFPTELTGRPYKAPFIEGLNLPLPDDEVIQVWSTEPAATANREKMLKGGWERIPHWGGDDTLERGGLLCEIPVYEIEKYLHPERKLLAAPAEAENTTRAISAIGATVQEFLGHRHELMQTVTEKQWDLTVQKWEMESVQRGLRKQMAEMEEKIHLAETYLHGIKSKVQLFKGDRGTGPYRVFQQRQFLNREVGLLANMTKFDFQNMEQLDEWLVKEGKLFTFLPFERTILVTRIRDTDKDYGNPFANWYMNQANMVSVIWIRDGKNVWRCNVDIDFDNCVFPDGSEAKRLTDYVTEYVFKEIYHDSGKNRWGDPDTREKQGTIKKNATEEEFPYVTRTKFPMRFKTMTEWFESEDYTTTVSVEIAKACNKSLIASNKRKMKFVLLLQGLVDNTNYLDIPKGTNLFDWQEASKFFVLLNDYTHALPDGHARDLIASATDRAQLRIGDTIIARAFDFEEGDERYKYQEGRRYNTRANRWFFYKIVSLKDGIKVAHHFSGKRYPYEPTKKSEMVALGPDQPFLRANLSQEVVNMMLGDREWKLRNTDLVPFLAQWKSVQEQYATCKNFTPCRLKSPEGEYYGD